MTVPMKPEQYKAAIVETILGMEPQFHVVARLRGGMLRPQLEDALYGWVARIDRHYLGRLWAEPCRRKFRTKGVAFFEVDKNGRHHAHLVLTPPQGASRLHFSINAAEWFRLNPETSLRGCLPRPVTRDGRMFVKWIMPTTEDRRRVVNYVAKGLERREMGSWKFLEELTPRQVL
jgi:hypothetical protein